MDDRRKSDQERLDAERDKMMRNSGGDGGLSGDGGAGGGSRIWAIWMILFKIFDCIAPDITRRCGPVGTLIIMLLLVGLGLGGLGSVSKKLEIPSKAESASEHVQESERNIPPTRNLNSGQSDLANLPPPNPPVSTEKQDQMGEEVDPESYQMVEVKLPNGKIVNLPVDKKQLAKGESTIVHLEDGQIIEIQPEVAEGQNSLKPQSVPLAPEIQPEPLILKSLEGVPLPCTLIVTEQASLLNTAGKETTIPVGTTIKVLTRKGLGSLGTEIKGAQFIGNESRLAGKVKLSNSPKSAGNSPKNSGFSTAGQIDARLGELQKSYDVQMANVNRLTNFRRKPVQKGTLAYDSLMEADAILRQVTTEAKTLKEKKAQLTGGGQ